MMKEPRHDSEILASVCLITYNHEAFIEQSLEAIVTQVTTFPFELIIGDDQSPDGTRSICEAFAARFPDIVRLLPSEKNMGIMPNLKRTLEAARGRYIALCEGDDYWTDPQKLQKQVGFLEANPEYVACYHDVKVVDRSGNLLRKSKNSLINKGDFSQDDLMKGRVMSLQSLCYRNVIKEYPYEIYNVLTIDKFLCSLLGQYGKGKYLANIEPAAYRVHDAGVWSLKGNVEKKMSLIKSYYWMWQYYDRTGNTFYANHFFHLIMREGYFSNPFQNKNASYIDKAEFLILRTLRKIFQIGRTLIPGKASKKLG